MIYQLTGSFEFQHPVEKVWSWVSDTERSNRVIGLPPVDYQERLVVGRPDSAARSARFGKMRTSGMTLEWEEHPYEWVRQKYFEVKRDYSSGPFRTMRVRWAFHETPQGCRIDQLFEFEPRFEWTGRFLRMQLRNSSLRKFLGLYAHINQQLSLAAGSPANQNALSVVGIFAAGAPPLDRKIKKQWIERLFQQGVPESAATRLLDHVFQVHSSELIRIRPFELARELGWTRDVTLSVLLKAAKAGVTALSWDLCCPSCKGAKARFSSLADLKGGAHCSFCNIQYDAVLDRSVELTFRVQPALREVKDEEFCIGSPQKTAHFLAQLRLPPGRTTHEIEFNEPGIYLLRSLQVPTEYQIEVGPSGGSRASFTLSEPGAVQVSPGPVQVEFNIPDSAGEVVCVLQRSQWLETACTAAYVTSFQEFRDIFSREVIRQDLQIQVSSLTVLFTDLKDSTAIYDQLGDAQAFGLVITHLDALTECVSANGGAVVKTAGDSIMASFTQPDQAVQAALAMQQSIRDFNGRGAERELHIKIGIHLGACFAVNFNDRLDYFGKNVNIAARAQSVCAPDEILITAAMVDDPAVKACLRRMKKTCVQVISQLKGFQQEFELYRITE